MCSDLKLHPKIDKSITSRHSTQQRTVDLMCHQMSALQPCLLNSPIQMLILPHCHCSGDCRSDHWTLHLQDTVPWSLQYFQHNYWALQNKFLGDWICRLTSHEDGLEFFFCMKIIKPKSYLLQDWKLHRNMFLLTLGLSEQSLLEIHSWRVFSLQNKAAIPWAKELIPIGWRRASCLVNGLTTRVSRAQSRCATLVRKRVAKKDRKSECEKEER